MKYTVQDLAQLEKRGVDTHVVDRQLEMFSVGAEKIHLTKPAKIGEGIHSISGSAMTDYIIKYQRTALHPGKFVPASGAASRMFKEHLAAWKSKEYSERSKELLENIKKLPFALGEITNIHRLYEELFDEYKLHEKPKGLLLFHRYANGYRTATEEHIFEWKSLIGEENGHLHFTVGQEDAVDFRHHAAAYVASHAIVGINCTFSVQDPSTDTLAVRPNNEPFRQENGELLFRPAGHGALLDNLSRLQNEIIFLKNIDNVPHADHQFSIIPYKQMLAGCLLAIRELIHRVLSNLDSGVSPAEKDLLELKSWLFWTHLPEREQLYTLLNRPIRVCGMVINEGAPGGGPFWVRHRGVSSLQIVEGAQIDENDPQQLRILHASTHFNPVDMVISKQDHLGRSYDLRQYSEQDWSFIADKTLDGLPLKALELPGLWNGGMAYWNTVFIEVPLNTFHPVKTINDLLKPGHQPKKGVVS